MRITRASALCCGLLLTAAACAGIPGTAGGGATTGGTTRTGSTTPSSGTVATDIVRYTNAARSRNGLPALTANAKLMEAARLHAQQMAQYQRAEHNISGAKYPNLLARIEAVGYDYANVAENVAWNQRDAQSVVNSWMNSSSHRTNILDRTLKEIGAAMARSSIGEPYWIQVFGTSR